jgi:N-acetylmuramoyl-L-alanine amidase
MIWPRQLRPALNIVSIQARQVGHSSFAAIRYEANAIASGTGRATRKAVSSLSSVVRDFSAYVQTRSAATPPEIAAAFPAVQVAGESPTEAATPNSPPAISPGLSLTKALGLKVNRIVIDAGHGGDDSGSIGAAGATEKMLTLDVAQRLGRLFQSRMPQMEVIYTRSDDSFLPPEQRTALANERGADLFLSIHANSSQNSGASGIETYYLSLDDATGPLEIAARENAMAQSALHELPEMLKKIASSDKIAESREFAANIEEALEKSTGRPGRGVRKAPFIVLVGANMPAVLTEISFLSNTEDEQWLADPDHREQIAEGLFQGVKLYLKRMNQPSKIAENHDHPAAAENDAPLPDRKRLDCSAAAGVTVPLARLCATPAELFAKQIATPGLHNHSANDFTASRRLGINPTEPGQLFPLGR